MGKIEAETCTVCKKNASKYRCPGCSAPYCSLACSKAHKSEKGGGKSLCAGKRPLKGTIAPPTDDRVETPGREKRPRASSDSNENSVSSSEEVPSGATGCARNPRDQWRGGKIEEDEEEEWRMSEDQRARLHACGWLKAALRDPKLQRLLSEIDTANNRQKTLDFHRASKQFGEFMDKLLLEIEEYRTGGPNEPALVAADS